MRLVALDEEIASAMAREQVGATGGSASSVRHPAAGLAAAYKVRAATSSS